MNIPSTMSAVPTHYGELAAALCAISEAYFNAGRLNDALMLLEQGAAISENSDIRPQDHMKLLLQRAKILNWDCFMNGTSVDISLAILAHVRQMAAAAGDEQQLAYALLYTGLAHDFRKLVTDEGDLDEPFAYFQQALDHFMAIADEKGIAEAHFSIAMIHQRRGQIDEMHSHLTTTLEIAEQHNLNYEKAEALWHLAYVHARRNEADISQEYALETLRLRKALGLKVMLPTTFQPIGMIYDALGDHTKALGYYQDALALAEEMDLKIPTMNALYALGGWQLQHGDAGQAKAYTARAYDIAQTINHQRGLATGISQLEQITG